MDIPKHKGYTFESVQCDDCGGNGCETCNDKGWLPADHPKGRRCHRHGCNNPIPPSEVAVYCSGLCAFLDAGGMNSDELTMTLYFEHASNYFKLLVYKNDEEVARSLLEGWGVQKWLDSNASKNWREVDTAMLFELVASELLKAVLRAPTSL